VGSLRVAYRSDLDAYQEGIRRWLEDDGSEEAMAAGCEIAEILIMWRRVLRGKFEKA
jgi:hypothetical protein